jgi:glutamyl-tRNA synthetase
VEMADAAEFYLQEEVGYQSEAVKKFFSPQVVPLLEALTGPLSSLSQWDHTTLEATFGELIAQTGATMKQIAQPLRLALTGKTASPGLFEVMEAMGKERTLNRLNQALNYIKGL